MPRRNDPSDVARVGAEVDAAAAELYALAPEDFVAARDARARALKGGGAPVAARAVAGLRRPTQSAWLVNLLVQQRAELVEDLLAVGAALHDAGLDPSVVKSLSAQRRRVVEELVREAVRLGSARSARAGADVRHEVQSTLDAALLDPEVGAAVRTGRLVRAVVRAGFPAETSGATPAPARPAPPRDSAAERNARAAAQREEDRRIREQRRAAEGAVRAAQRAVEVAERAAEAAAAGHARHEETLVHLREQLQDAQRRDAELALARRSAEADLQRRRDAVEAARAALDTLG